MLIDFIEKIYKDSFENILRKKYIDENKSIFKVAKELNISVGTVYNYLSKYKISKNIL